MALITPMRAADLKGDLSLIQPHHYPVVLSPKFDGYRATTQPGFAPGEGSASIVVYSKNNKPIPNAYVQQQLNHWAYTMLDGELIVGDPLEPGSLQRTSSGVTTRTGEPDFNFWVFDDIARLDLPFISRLARLSERFKKQLRGGGSRVCLVPHKIVLNVKELIAYEAQCVAAGWEGVMVRSREASYKQGGAEPRATLTELEVAKLKRKEHHEAKVLSVYEQMENTNEASRDEIGRKKRSTAKAGKVGKGVLGGCHVVGTAGRWEGVEYDVGGGWTDAQRAKLWVTGDMIGRIMKVETGVTPATFKAPQFPRFVDWKWEGDV